MMPKIGTGERFAAMEGKLAGKGIRNPGALAAKIGREKYGEQRFNKMAETGRARMQAQVGAMKSKMT